MNKFSLVRVTCALLTGMIGALRVNAASSGTVVAWGATDSGQAVVPAGLTDVIAIAAGSRHCLALKSDGTVVAWGENAYGQATVPAGLSGVKAIAAGDVHSVALKNDGTVIVWGDNTTGEADVPPGLRNVVAITAGSPRTAVPSGGNLTGGTTVALKSDGTVVAWGWNRLGQAIVPAGLTGVIAIAGGGAHVLALKNDGTVVAWGGNTEFSNGAEAIVPTGLNGVVAIAAGYNQSFAVTKDGTLVAWGNSSSVVADVPANLGQVAAVSIGISVAAALRRDGTVVAWGNNSDGQNNVPAGLKNVTAIAAGGRYCAAIVAPQVTAASFGTVVAWGDNTSGQLNVPAGLSGVTAISAGAGSHVVALKNDGTVVAWGDNSFGQSTIPAGLNGVIAISAGSTHTVALKRDGTVIAWGDNTSGQINVPASLSEVTAIAAGGGYTVALKSDGTVVAWGSNFDGQMNLPDGLTGVIAISASAHVMALKRDGTIVAWGRNNNGQSTVPPGLSHVTAIAARAGHSLALTSDGTVAAWGLNNYGQIDVPLGLSGVTAITGGGQFSMVLLRDGTVVEWGQSREAQIAIPAGLSGITAITAGLTFSVALVGTGATAPSFAAQPISQTVAPGSTAVFNAAATGPTSYQWRKDGVNIAGATTSTLSVPTAGTAQAGVYSVVVTNNLGSAISNNATLALSNSANFGHLINLSIRAGLSATDSSFTIGTVIGGAPGTKPLLVRAVGPSLAQFGINNAISAAKLDVFAGAAVVASNDGWGGSTTMSNAFASVGAFALASPSSKDSAVFDPGILARDYTVRVSAGSGASGEVLAELYDAAPLSSFNASTPRLVNVSVRKTIAAAETLTVGFVIAGDTARTVLVRAIGPGLAAFGVPGTMPDPQLALFSSEGKIAENDDWSGDAQLTSIGSAVGAFKIDDGRGRDAMLLLTLPPGSYTAQVKAAGTGGQALVEVYEVP